MTESAIAIVQKFIFDFCIYFAFTIYVFFLYLVSTFATFADCVNMGIIGTCSRQSVLVRRAVMKVNRASE